MSTHSDMCQIMGEHSCRSPKTDVKLCQDYLKSFLEYGSNPCRHVQRLFSLPVTLTHENRFWPADFIWNGKIESAVKCLLKCRVCQRPVHIRCLALNDFPTLWKSHQQSHAWSESPPLCSSLRGDLPNSRVILWNFKIQVLTHPDFWKLSSDETVIGVDVRMGYQFAVHHVRCVKACHFL